MSLTDNLSVFPLPERLLQRQIVDALAWLLPPTGMAFAIPNQRRGATQAELVSLVRQGMRPGIPDLMVVHQGNAIGIELKTAAGRLSPAQKVTHADLNRAGVPVIVASSLEQVVAGLEANGVELREAVIA